MKFKDTLFGDLTGTTLQKRKDGTPNSIYLENKGLSSLEGCPDICEESMFLENNHLTDLRYAPKKVLGMFDVSKNSLSSLKHCPTEVSSFMCDDNLLKTLEYQVPDHKTTNIIPTNKGSSELRIRCILDIINKNWNLTPKGIIEYLELNKPVYKETATYGHFGRDDVDFSWEKIIDIKK